MRVAPTGKIRSKAFDPNTPTPLVASIKRHGGRTLRFPPLVLLIDDARCLGQGDYPSLDQLTRRARAVPGIAHIEVAEDIVRCTPDPVR